VCVLCIHEISLSLSRSLYSSARGLERISWYLVEWVSLRTPSQPFILGSSGPHLYPSPPSPPYSLPSLLAHPLETFVLYTWLPGPLLAFLGSVPCVCVRLMCPKAIRRCLAPCHLRLLATSRLKGVSEGSRRETPAFFSAATARRNYSSSPSSVDSRRVASRVLPARGMIDHRSSQGAPFRYTSLCTSRYQA